MKILKITLLFIILYQSAFSQTYYSTNGINKRNTLYHGTNFNRNTTTPATYDATTPYVLNVYFTLINDGTNHSLLPNGVLDTPQLIEDKFLECIKYLNKNFRGTNIFFKYAGYQAVPNATMADGEFGITIPPNFTNPYIADVTQYEKVDAMNIIFLPLNPINTDYWTYFGYNMSMLTIDLLNNNPQLEKIITHTMGHSLSLYHTDEVGSHFAEGHPLHDFTACEHVTRDPWLTTMYNADIAGDEVTDTPAQPRLEDSFFTNCEVYNFDATRVNCVPEPYENLTSGNPMNSFDYLSPRSCPLVPFTAGQTKRMRECILNSPTTPSFDFAPELMGVLQNTRNTVASLFTPYSMGTTVFPTILSTTDNGDGTAKVCRGYISADFKFQPGFTYTFLAEPDTAAAIVSSASVNDYPVIVHEPAFNCPILIGELSPTLTNLASNLGQVETVCRGEVCVTEAFIRGTDIRTEILGSMNITVKELDAIEVKDPDLYQKLMEQYYHILEKYTASGAKIREVFYKQ